jgi:hypothetical protein
MSPSKFPSPFPCNTILLLLCERKKRTVATQRVAPDLKAEGYDLSRGYINKQMVNSTT